MDHRQIPCPLSFVLILKLLTPRSFQYLLLFAVAAFAYAIKVEPKAGSKERKEGVCTKGMMVFSPKEADSHKPSDPRAGKLGARTNDKLSLTKMIVVGYADQWSRQCAFTRDRHIQVPIPSPQVYSIYPLSRTRSGYLHWMLLGSLGTIGCHWKRWQLF